MTSLQIAKEILVVTVAPHVLLTAPDAVALCRALAITASQLPIFRQIGSRRQYVLGQPRLFLNELIIPTVGNANPT
jgi:hypothetical protein